MVALLPVLVGLVKVTQGRKYQRQVPQLVLRETVAALLKERRSRCEQLGSPTSGWRFKGLIHLAVEQRLRRS
jgi:hypothetical protein